ncbi:MAG: DUF2165 domain-containing protein [Xanthomonadales bacterium]|nr:DUF2165 domain-containing protein [Xanthomonadales bacterium]
MNIRLLKILVVEFLCLMALLYAAQNVVNIESARAVVGLVLSMEGHEYYPAHLLPAITSNALVWACLVLIIALEFLTAFFLAWGAWDMWKARTADAAVFNAAKANALKGALVGMIVWLGLFGAIGGAYFQMWQTEVGAMSLGDALRFGMIYGVLFVVIHARDD